MWKSVSRIHPILILFLIIVINIHYDQDIVSDFEQAFNKDLDLCFECYQHQIQECQHFHRTISYDPEKNLLNLFNSILPKGSKRHRQWLTLKNDSHTKIIAKDFSHNFSPKEVHLYRHVGYVKRRYLSAEKLEGFQFCPHITIERFVQRFLQSTNELAIWLYMLINVQPMLLPTLEELQFPVPKTFAVCGFTLFQGYAGESIDHFSGAAFQIKLQIGKLLLQGAEKFSYGFDGFRFYITDLSLDNVVYDEQHNILAFIDLDTIYVVDSQRKNLKSTIHRQEYMDCPNCFAYSPQDICSHPLSDMNLFQVCQILREDLERNPGKGFLQPIPHDIQRNYPQLRQLMDQCVECDPTKCDNRFPIASKLIKQIDQILYEVYKIKNHM